MADFKIAEKITAGNEGGYANDPNDRGKRTLNGISQVFWPNWEGWPRLMAIIKLVGEDAKKINAEVNKDAELLRMISAFYKKEFWDVNSLDHVKSQSIANEMYDTGVNMGKAVAAKFLQEALNLCNKNGFSYPEVGVDGKISPTGETLRTLNTKANEIAVLNTFNMLQGERYLKIMRADSSQEKFWQSWLHRVIVTGKW